MESCLAVQIREFAINLSFFHVQKFFHLFRVSNVNNHIFRANKKKLIYNYNNFVKLFIKYKVYTLIK